VVEFPTNLFKSLKSIKANNAIEAQEKQPQNPHIPFAKTGEIAGRNEFNHMKKSIKDQPHALFQSQSNSNKPKSPLPQLLTDPHKNAPFTASPPHLDT
jgi:hypothetical protein